jgi:hypothetical protein
MDETQEQVQLREIPAQYAPRYAVIDAALQAGIQQSDIATGLGLTRGAITHAKHALNRKYDLTSTKLVKLAHSAVKTTLQGQAVGEADPPKASTIIETAKMVYDRYQPAKSQDIGSTTNTFVQINLGSSCSPSCLSGGMEAHDITPDQGQCGRDTP